MWEIMQNDFPVAIDSVDRSKKDDGDDEKMAGMVF